MTALLYFETPFYYETISNSCLLILRQAPWPDLGVRHPCAALYLFPILPESRIQSGRGLPHSKDSLRSSINHLNPEQSILNQENSPYGLNYKPNKHGTGFRLRPRATP